MTRPDLAFAYSEFSKFVQFPQPPHMLSDLAFAYSEFSKFVQCPQTPHMISTQDILRYLHGTYELGIRYHHNALNPDLLWGWVDKDWEGDIETRHSHIVYVLMFNGVPISWKSLR
jgi:hypothetical protein